MKDRVQTRRGVLQTGSFGFGPTRRAKKSRATTSFPELAAVCSTAGRFAWEHRAYLLFTLIRKSCKQSRGPYTPFESASWGFTRIRNVFRNAGV